MATKRTVTAGVTLAELERRGDWPAGEDASRFNGPDLLSDL
jgi:hypothetical protein